MTDTVFETERLTIRKAGPDDAELLYTLWKDPRVMRNVGFPEGLPITREQVLERLRKEPETEYERNLVVVRKADGEVIGECYLHRPDEDGIASTDVKLLPDYWSHHYGVEVKQGLVDYHFTHSDCVAVQGTPNRRNIASIRMQEAVGGVKVSEEVYEFPADAPGVTEDVPALIYRVFRETWEKRRES
ncbi:MAG: GNAT family N-acetyltransferase [Planctomycetota bacterium]